MRGFPLLNLLLALFLSGAVLLPLVFRATRVVPVAAVETARPEAPGAAEGISSYVSLRFVHAPVSVRLMNGGDVLKEWADAGGALLLDDTMQLPFNERRSEFTVAVTWPAGTPMTMVEITLEPDGLAARKVNVWSEGAAADELVTLTWEGAP